MFRIGDTVEAIDEEFKGIVSEIKGDDIGVQDDDGFILYFRESELIPQINVSIKKELSHVPDDVLKEKEHTKRKKSARVKPKERNAPPLEVDLHIHKLVDRSGGMSNYEILNLQLDTARGQLEFAIRKRLQKVVFIHGVGEGVLREELYTLLRRFDNVKYYDADFKKYGVGATEVYIYQNT